MMEVEGRKLGRRKEMRMERRWGPTEIKGLFGRWPSTMSTFFDKVRKVSTLKTSSTVRMGACDGRHGCVCFFSAWIFMSARRFRDHASQFKECMQSSLFGVDL